MSQLILKTFVCSRLMCRNFASKSPSVLVYLLDKSGNIIDTKTKAQAEQLAKKQKCILVKKDVARFKYEAYVMLDPRRDHIDDEEEVVKQDNQFEQNTEKVGETEFKSKESEKGGKKGKEKPRELRKIHLGANISSHDLEIKAKQIKKFLTSNNDVLVSFFDQKASPGKFEKLYEQFVSHLSGFRIVQKNVSTTHLKFTILGEKGDHAEASGGKHSSKELDEEAILKKLLNEESMDEMVQEQMKRLKKEK